MMKSKSIKLFILGLLFISFIILIPNIANANSISKITMDIFIEDNGDAKVTEVWETNLNQGTEGYKTYKNLGEKSITDFSVVDNTGKAYETVNNWNTQSSFSQKAYKCGITKIAGGYELCWGISEYGNRKYKLTYKIENFVIKYSDDVQGIYFDFLNIDMPVDKCYIRIRSNTKLSQDNSKIWSLGFYGNSSLKDGSILFISDGTVSKSQNIVGLIRFQDNLFNVKYKDKYKTFDDIYDLAMEGTDNSSSDNIDNFNTIEFENSSSDNMDELKQSKDKLEQELKGEVSTAGKSIVKIIIFVVIFSVISLLVIIIIIIIFVSKRKKKTINNSNIYDKEE
ncbi:MAG: DUF2207 domain-containing protein [Clostridia bacterium]|nr:DUF2207 domain-containing protein [Clostridia bacterium]